MKQRPPTPFGGFPQKSSSVRVPTAFFTQLLPQIHDANELKVILYTFWALEQQESNAPALRWSDYAQDARLMNSLGKTAEQAEAALQQALLAAVQRGVLLQGNLQGQDPRQATFFLNSPRGRAALKAWQEHFWQSNETPLPTLADERPNIFQLYEENIGPLTLLIAERLREAEETYPTAWIEEAMRIAIERNVRNWRYIEAILTRWQEEGRDGAHRTKSEKDQQRYIEGEFGKFVEH